MVENRPNDSVHTEAGEHFVPVIEAWKKAERTFEQYSAGMVIPGNDPREAYQVLQNGRILRIDGHPVMATCEAPWAERTVLDSVEEATKRLKQEYDLKILDVGFGIGITAGKYFESIVFRGSGELHIIELNHQAACDARRWAKERMKHLQDRLEKQGNSYDQIRIFIHEGEMRKESEELLRKGKKFDIICADTFPLSEEETGVHDIINADIFKELLYPEGVFTFFAYYPEANQTSLSAEQLAILDQHFERNITGRTVAISPPKEYEYLWVNGKPVRRLPVVICAGPKTDLENQNENRANIIN